MSHISELHFQSNHTLKSIFVIYLSAILEFRWRLTSRNHANNIFRSDAHENMKVIIIIIIIITSLLTPDRPQAGIQRHHTGMRGAGVAPVGCQPQGPACRQPTANTAPMVHLSQPKLVPTLLLGGQGYMCVNNLPKVVTRYASAVDRTRDLPIASRESRALTI